MELELGADAASFAALLAFLACGFGGGTDVDAPLALCLERVASEEWALVRAGGRGAGGGGGGWVGAEEC